MLPYNEYQLMIKQTKLYEAALRGIFREFAENPNLFSRIEIGKSIVYFFGELDLCKQEIKEKLKENGLEKIFRYDKKNNEFVLNLGEVFLHNFDDRKKEFFEFLNENIKKTIKISYNDQFNSEKILSGILLEHSDCEEDLMYIEYETLKNKELAVQLFQLRKINYYQVI